MTWSGSTMILTPADPLALETGYVLTVDEGIHDLSGNPMTELPPPFEFVTAGRPTLVESEPADGAEEVPLDAPITLTFSTLMDIASVEDRLRLSPSFDHELRWSGELLEIVPSQPLDPGSDYAVEVEADAADAAGVTLLSRSGSRSDRHLGPHRADARANRRRGWRRADLPDRGRLQPTHRPGDRRR